MDSDHGYPRYETENPLARAVGFIVAFGMWLWATFFFIRLALAIGR